MKKTIHFKTFAFVAILALFAYPTFAQEGNRQGDGQRSGQRPGGGMGRQQTEENVKERVKRQSQALSLNEEQEKKILEFEIGQYKKNQVEFQKNQGDREAMRTYMRSQRELRDKKYEEVLTEEQFKQYTLRQEERQEQMRQRREGNRDRNPQNDMRPERGRGRR